MLSDSELRAPTVYFATLGFDDLSIRKRTFAQRRIFILATLFSCSIDRGCHKFHSAKEGDEVNGRESHLTKNNMNRPLGEYQKNMIDGVLKKYGKYTVKRPIDKQTIRCLNSLVKRGLVTFDAETETYRLKPNPTGIRRA